MKPQTFEEWREARYGDTWRTLSIGAQRGLEEGWRVGHENAARVCDTSGYHVVMQTLSDAIRAQGSK